MMKKASIKSFFTKDKSPKTPTEDVVWGELCTTNTPPQQYTPNKSSRFSPKKSPNKQYSPKSPSPNELSPKTNSSGNRGRVDQNSTRDGGIVNRRVSDSNAQLASSVLSSQRSSRSLSRPKKAVSQRDILSSKKKHNGRRFPLANYKSQSAVDLDDPIEAYNGPIDCDEVSLSSISEHGKEESRVNFGANNYATATQSDEAALGDVGTERNSPDTIPLVYEECSGFRPSTPDNVDIEKHPLTMPFTNDETIDLPKDTDDETVYSLSATLSEESIIAPMSMDEMENKNATILGRMETDDSALDDGDYYRQDYFSMMTKSKREVYEDESNDNTTEEYEGKPISSLSERVLMTEEGEDGAANRLWSCELTGITEPELPAGLKKECEGDDYGDLYTDAPFPICGDEEENHQNNTAANIPSSNSNDGDDIVIERNGISEVQVRNAPFIPDDRDFMLEGQDGPPGEDSVECDEFVEDLDIVNIPVEKEIISVHSEDSRIDQDYSNSESDRFLDQSNNTTSDLDNACQNDIVRGTLEENAAESNAVQLDESDNADHDIIISLFEANDAKSNGVQLNESDKAADIKKSSVAEAGGATKLLYSECGTNDDMNLAECTLESNKAEDTGMQFDESDKAADEVEKSCAANAGVATKLFYSECGANDDMNLAECTLKPNEAEDTRVQLDDSDKAADEVEKSYAGVATKLLYSNCENNDDMNISESISVATDVESNSAQFDDSDKTAAAVEEETAERNVTQFLESAHDDNIFEFNGDGDSVQLDESGKFAAFVDSCSLNSSDSSKISDSLCGNNTADDNSVSKKCCQDIAAIDATDNSEKIFIAFEINSSDANGHKEMEKDEPGEPACSGSELDAPKSATTEGSVCKREIDTGVMNETNLIPEETNTENIRILELTQSHESDQALETDSLPIMYSRSRSLSPSLRTTHASSVEKPYLIGRTTSLPLRWKPFPSSSPANSSIHSKSPGTRPKENLEHCSTANTPLAHPSLETSSIDVREIIHENQRLRVKRQQLCDSLSNMAQQFQQHENASAEKIFSLEQKIRALAVEKESTLPADAKTEGCYNASTVHQLSTGVLELSKEIEAKDKMISQLLLRFDVLKRMEEQRTKLDEFATSPEEKCLQTELFESRAALKNALSDIDALTAALESNNVVLDECVEELESLRQFKSSHTKENLQPAAISRTSMPTLITRASKGNQNDVGVTPDGKSYYHLEEEVQLLRKEANSARFELGLANQHIQQLSAELKAQTEHVNGNLLCPSADCQTEGFNDSDDNKNADLKQKMVEFENSSSVENEVIGEAQSNETELVEVRNSTESPSKSLLTARKLFQPLRGWATSPRVHKSLSSETSDLTENDVAKLHNIIKANTEVMDKLKRDIIKVQSDKDDTEFEMQNEIQKLKEENDAYASQVTILEESFRKMNDIRQEATNI